MRMTFIFTAMLGALILIPVAVVLSAAQGAWIKYERNPILEPGAPGTWDDLGVFSADILFDQTTKTYKMWYTGSGSGDSREDIGYATSSNGLSWAKSASNPVLSHGLASEWDYNGISAPTVVYDAAASAAQRWKMWYAGLSLKASGYRIGYATSPDGITWTKHPTYVLDVSTDGSDDSNVLSPTVVNKNGLYHMWYAGRGARNQIFYATSTDGINWNKYAGNPVMLLGGDTEWDNGEISAPSIMATAGGFELWYQGLSRSTQKFYIGHATSPNGNNWTKDAMNPVLGIEPNTWDAHSVYYPSVGNFNGQMMMWYHGERNRAVPQKIGLALFDESAEPTPRPTFPPVPLDDSTPEPDPTDSPTPGGFGLLVNNGALFTNQITVTLQITAPNTAHQMLVSNSSGFTIGQWEPYAAARSWLLDPTGSQTDARRVFVKFADTEENMLAVRFDDIKLDMTPPSGTVAVLKSQMSAAGTNANTLLNLVEDDVSGVGEMRFSNEPDLAGAAWEVFAPTKSWTFDQRGMVYAQFRDLADNVSIVMRASLADAQESLFLPFTSRQ